MGTDYGTVEIQFPGFPTIRFNTMNRYAQSPGTERPWCYWARVRLPSRKIGTIDGLILHLSRKERSRLRSLLWKWNHHRGYDGSWHGRVRPKDSYRTLGET